MSFTFGAVLGYAVAKYGKLIQSWITTRLKR